MAISKSNSSVMRIQDAFKDPDGSKARISKQPSVEVSSKSWLRFMLAVTSLYLCIELPFNARLLDIAGGLATEEEMNSIEVFGRFISGTALALAIWGLFIMPRSIKKAWPMPQRVAVMAAVTVASLMLAYHGERKLIDKIVDGTSGAQRHAAMRLQLMSFALRNDDVHMDGIDLSPEQVAAPAGKAFFALFPVLALSTDKLVEKTDTAISDLIRTRVEREIGSAEHFYNSAYLKSVKGISESYNRYVDGVNKMVDALDSSPDEQRRAWHRYVGQLQRNGYIKPADVPPERFNRVRQSVRDDGVNVPDTWKPTDQRTFYEAVARKVRNTADSKYKSVVKSELGEGVALPPSLSYDQFAAHSAVQKRWRKELGLADTSVSIRTDMNLDRVKSGLWEQLVQKNVAEQRKMYVLEPDKFADGGPKEEQGRSAMRGVVVPPIALSLSLLGALVHLFKVSNFGLKLAIYGRKIQWPKRLLICTIAAFALAPFLATNQITESRLFGYFDRQTDQEMGPAVALAVTWIVQMQPYAYPVNELMRETVLLGYDFGYSPK